MGKIFRCGALLPDCDAVLTGETVAEILAQAADHVRRAHGMASLLPELAAETEAAIEESADGGAAFVTNGARPAASERAG